MLQNSPGLSLSFASITLIIGLCMGSFLCCAGQRAARGASVLRGRSHCDACGRILHWQELIPLLSFAFVGGRCRSCGKRLSLLLPAAELFTAAVYLLLLLRCDLSLRLLEGLLLSSVMIACACADLEAYLIPDRFLLIGVLGRLILLLFSPDLPAHFLSALLGAVCVAAGVLLVALLVGKVLKRDAMGGGDIKLLFLSGLYLGWQKNLLCLLLACFLGLIFGAVVLHRKERDRRRGAPGSGMGEQERQAEKLFPWGPAISLAAIAAFAFGDGIIAWYLGLFGW